MKIDKRTRGGRVRPQGLRGAEEIGSLRIGLGWVFDESTPISSHGIHAFEEPYAGVLAIDRATV